MRQKVLRQQQVEARLAEYSREVLASARIFREAFAAACEGGPRERLREIFGRLHQAESDADDIRRSTETQMYTEALFPESRGDILGLLPPLCDRQHQRTQHHRDGQYGEQVPQGEPGASSRTRDHGCTPWKRFG